MHARAYGLLYDIDTEAGTVVKHNGIGSAARARSSRSCSVDLDQAGPERLNREKSLSPFGESPQRESSNSDSLAISRHSRSVAKCCLAVGLYELNQVSLGLSIEAFGAEQDYRGTAATRKS